MKIHIRIIIIHNTQRKKEQTMKQDMVWIVFQ